MFYTNKITKEVAFFNGIPSDDWVKSTKKEIDSYELEREKRVRISHCKSALAANDWQAAAYIKRGRPLDADLAEKESVIASTMNEIENCLTLEELEKININFE